MKTKQLSGCVAERRTFGRGDESTCSHFETWATSYTPLYLCLSEVTLKAVGPFCLSRVNLVLSIYLVSIWSFLSISCQFGPFYLSRVNVVLSIYLVSMWSFLSISCQFGPFYLSRVNLVLSIYLVSVPGEVKCPTHGEKKPVVDSVRLI